VKSWTYSVALCAALSACASQPGAIEEKPAGALELSLSLADGRRIKLSALDGQPRLLFLFATYDQASQLAIVPLSRFVEQNPNASVLGVLVQPDAETFIPLFQESLSLPFALYAEPENKLLHGKTPIGPLAGVPAYVALDARGRIRDVRYGVANEADLRTLIDRAR
jgi:hypothetical protein